MGNSYFQFKQFRIEQGSCAMKVTTDACILGAWVPVLPGVRRIMDIGAGTGLLTLMLAQRTEGVFIDGIELDSDACAQARQNVSSSPWGNRVTIIEGDVKQYHPAEKYDVIITNPPFFNNSLLGPAAARNAARHTVWLSYNELINAIAANLSTDGYAAILLPLEESKTWKEVVAAKGWHIFKQLQVLHRPGAVVKRVVLLMSPTARGAEEETEQLVIQNQDGTNTSDFIALVQDFYLKA